jgi:hypothetical protein
MRSAIAALLLLAGSAAYAQDRTDETITLDAAQKHIVQSAYHDDKAVTFSGRAAGGWHLYAGAAIDAQRIDLTMRNVRGVVRFHADWSRVRSILDQARRREVIEQLR